VHKILLFLGDSAITGNRTGVGTYHLNIIKALEQPFDILFSRHPAENMLPGNARVLVISKFKRKLIGLFKFVLPMDLFFPGYSLVFTDSSSPFFFNKQTRVFTIIHDLMHITERNHSTLKSRIWAFWADKTLKRAHKIIAVSENTKTSLITHLHLSPEKIAVIPNTTDFFVTRENPGDYFLFIGEMRRNKNLLNTIKGFLIFLKNSMQPYKLLICGPQTGEYEGLNAFLAENNCSGVVFPGYIDDREKAELFKRTRALVLVSKNEGFGIPVIEALSNNIPVLVSDIPVFREVAGEAAHYVLPGNPESIAAGFSHMAGFKPDEQFLRSCNAIREKYSFPVFKNKINSILS
jgi:glycosyltransferase involved in cell wall biosynthesis